MKVNDYLSREDIATFTAKSDWQAGSLVLGNWLLIAIILSSVAAWPNPLTIVLAIVMLAGRQLGLSVLMHDCGHRTLFRSPLLNDHVGQWLCALPVLNDQPSYARGHLEHHRRAGTTEDPDLPNYGAYPVSAESFRRKVLRDLTGQTGFKLLAFIVRGAAGIMSRENPEDSFIFIKQLLVQLALFLVLFVFGIGWTYCVWAIAYLTVFMLIVRVRQIAEHAAVPNQFDTDVRKNTRTVEAPWWQRLVFAPFGVNFHMEHHFMASVPCYKLSALREHLQRQQALENVPVFSGYGQLLRHAVTA